MLGFFMKRKFVNDVVAITSTCFHEATAGRPNIDGFVLAKDQYLARIDEWLKREEVSLNAQGYDGISAMGDAMNRGIVWVGVFLVRGAVAHGAPSVPPDFIKKFYDPAVYVNNAYFQNMRAHSSEPFTKAFQAKMEEALAR